MKSSTYFESDYNRLENLWSQTAGYYRFWVPRVGGMLDLDERQVLADVGCGQGAFTRQVVAAYRLAKCYAVEPYVEVREPYRTGLEVRVEEPIRFFRATHDVTRVLFKQVLHHIPVPDQEVLFSLLLERLPNGGRVLVMTMPPEIEFPMFAAAKAFFREHQIHYESCARRMERAGWTVDVETGRFPVEIAKPAYFDLLRAKFLSDLRDFSDREIEEGIREVDGACAGETLRFDDELFCVVGRK